MKTPPPPSSVWTKVDDYYLQSDRGYRISRARAGTIKFSAWAPPASSTGQYTLLGVVDSSTEAKALCSKHMLDFSARTMPT